MTLPHKMMMAIKNLELAMYWWSIQCSFLTMTYHMTLAFNQFISTICHK
jgi:hypothetical protein